MFFALDNELAKLRREYEKPTSHEDILIQMEIENIIHLQNTCKNEDRKLANAIIDKFCEIIRLMKEQHEIEMNYLAYHVENEAPRTGFMTYDAPMRDPKAVPFERDEDLLVAFYNRFCNEQKRRTEKDPVRYREISHITQLREEGANPTMRDYVARVNTFAKRYLSQVFPLVPEYECDPILFIYANLELILARFDTSGSKQKVNIRSALRKLNEFKQEQDSCKFRQ